MRSHIKPSVWLNEFLHLNLEMLEVLIQVNRLAAWFNRECSKEKEKKKKNDGRSPHCWTIKLYAALDTCETMSLM